MEYFDYIIFITLFVIFAIINAIYTLNYYKAKEKIEVDKYDGLNEKLKEEAPDLEGIDFKAIGKEGNRAEYEISYLAWGAYVVFFTMLSNSFWEYLDGLPLFILIIASFVFGFIVPELLKKVAHKINKIIFRIFDKILDKMIDKKM